MTPFRADELTEGDIIQNPTGDVWQVLTEPEYTNEGITFLVMWLGVDSPDNTQEVCLAPQSPFELLDREFIYLNQNNHATRLDRFPTPRRTFAPVPPIPARPLL